MKKTTKLITISLLGAAASVCCIFAGCHEHSYSPDCVDEKSPTCTEDGYRITYCPECNEERFHEVLPAYGHNYYDETIHRDGDYCASCGEPNPASENFVSGENYGNAQLSADGILSWGRLKEAVKYEISLTYSGSSSPEIYELEKTKDRADLNKIAGGEEFPTGKTAVKFLPYGVHKETVDGEKIEQEYPMTELSDEFIVTKFNGAFSIARMKYSDDFVTLNGFYSDAKQDDSGNTYYLYETKLKDNKATQFNVSNFVKPASGYTVAYYRTEADRAAKQNAVSSMDLRFMYINAGGNFFYATLSGNGESRDYDLKIYGLMTLSLNFFEVSSTTENGYRKDSYTKVGPELTYTEGDIVPKEVMFANNKFSQRCARDGNYNYLEYKDYILSAPDSGNSVNIYYSENVSADCNSVSQWKRYYTLTETENGWILDNRYSQSEYTNFEIPDTIINKRVIAARFYESNVTNINLNASNVSLSFTNCTSLISVYISQNVKQLQSGAFAGANSDLVIRCAFDEEYANTNFSSGWNSKNATSIWSGKFTTQYAQ